MIRIEITESDKSLLELCLSIARARFESHAQTLANAGAIAQFERQAADAQRLIDHLSTADRVIIETLA